MNESDDILKSIRDGKITINKISNETYDILIAGDFCPIGSFEQLCLNNQYQDVFTDLLPILSDKDLSIVNLECPLAAETDPINKTGPNLIADPQTVKMLDLGKFDVVTLANNHILDQGRSGLVSTLDVCQRNGLKIVGAGINIGNASKILDLEIKGNRVAILNFTEHEFSIASKDKAGANPLDPISNYYSIREAEKRADLVIVVIHGGNEHYPLPSPWLKKVFRYYADLGADIVVGHHSHCTSGLEIYHGVPLIFGLGNFIFPWPDGDYQPWYEGMLVKFKVSQSILVEIELIPYEQRRETPLVSLMKGKEKETFLGQIASYSEIISDQQLLETEWNRFSRKRRKDYLGILLSLNRLKRYLFKKGLYKVEKSKLNSLLNIIRCESHNELAKKILENEINEKE